MASGTFYFGLVSVVSLLIWEIKMQIQSAKNLASAKKKKQYLEQQDISLDSTRVHNKVCA